MKNLGKSNIFNEALVSYPKLGIIWVSTKISIVLKHLMEIKYKKLRLKIVQNKEFCAVLPEIFRWLKPFKNLSTAVIHNNGFLLMNPKPWLTEFSNF